ncbi:hypothetical protein [Methylopila sp. 73B]|uniref:hypothetical protein n=1 Tax=Methylopila sp. 73B TaxID=1120792 RepID=UPI00037F367A|nr:hypothetical protein [Methylopila sp. 73B]
MSPVSDYRDRVKMVGKMAADAEQIARTTASSVMTRVDLGEVDLSLNLTVSVQTGIVSINAPLAGAKVGDMLTLRPAATWAAGFAPTNYAFVTSAGRIEARLIVPVITLALAGTVTLKARVIALRTA